MANPSRKRHASEPVTPRSLKRPRFALSLEKKVDLIQDSENGVFMQSESDPENPHMSYEDVKRNLCKLKAFALQTDNRF
jgi:hypothetical protein